MNTTAHAENRYHRSLTEVTESELLRAIRLQQQDAGAAHDELVRRGWSENQITDGLPTPEQRVAQQREAVRYTTTQLEADVAAGGYGIMTHPRVAAELLRLDTVDRRKRAMAEAYTLGNLLGGVPSGSAQKAVSDLLTLIREGSEDSEMYGERVAREYREAEKARRFRPPTGRR